MVKWIIQFQLLQLRNGLSSFVVHNLFRRLSVLDMKEQLEEDDNDAYDQDGMAHHVKAGILPRCIFQTGNPQEISPEEDN